MKLFTIGSDHLVELNKEWIMLIPEFNELLKRDKGSPGDYRGEKKLKARKEFTFIYFDLDFASPIREWPDKKRRETALKYALLEESDLDAAVMRAHTTYNELMMGISRSLKTLKAIEKSLDELDEYFENINFKDKDSYGKLIHDPKTYLNNLRILGDAYDSVDAFKARVKAELMNTDSIRGTATLGGKEGKREQGWSEKKSEATEIEKPKETKAPTIKQTSFIEMGQALQALIQEPIEKEEVE